MSNDFVILLKKSCSGLKGFLNCILKFLFPVKVLKVSKCKNVQFSQCSANINPKEVLFSASVKLLSRSVFQQHYYTQSLKQ